MVHGYAVRDAAARTGRAVFSTQQLANLTGSSRPTARAIAARLVRAGLATRLVNGKVSFSDDDHVIATQLVEPSYVSLHSALLFHGFVQQVPVFLECVTTRNTIAYPRLGIRYHKIPPSLFAGHVKHERGTSYAFIAEPEKAVIDGVYLNVMSPELVSDIKDGLDQARLGTLLSTFRGKGAIKLREVLLGD